MEDDIKIVYSTLDKDTAERVCKEFKEANNEDDYYIKSIPLDKDLTK